MIFDYIDDRHLYWMLNVFYLILLTIVQEIVRKGVEQGSHYDWRVFKNFRFIVTTFMEWKMLKTIAYDYDGTLTDVPAMKYVKDHGGKTVLLQPKDSKLWADNSMIDFVSLPDFREGSELSNYIEGLLAA